MEKPLHRSTAIPPVITLSLSLLIGLLQLRGTVVTPNSVQSVSPAISLVLNQLPTYPFEVTNDCPDPSTGPVVEPNFDRGWQSLFNIRLRSTFCAYLLRAPRSNYLLHRFLGFPRSEEDPLLTV